MAVAGACSRRRSRLNDIGPSGLIITSSRWGRWASATRIVATSTASAASVVTQTSTLCVKSVRP